MRSDLAGHVPGATARYTLRGIGFARAIRTKDRYRRAALSITARLCEREIADASGLG